MKEAGFDIKVKFAWLGNQNNRRRFIAATTYSFRQAFAGS
jgi:hypothetical protein